MNDPSPFAFLQNAPTQEAESLPEPEKAAILKEALAHFRSPPPFQPGDLVRERPHCFSGRKRKHAIVVAIDPISISESFRMQGKFAPERPMMIIFCLDPDNDIVEMTVETFRYEPWDPTALATSTTFN